MVRIYLYFRDICDTLEAGNVKIYTFNRGLAYLIKALSNTIFLKYTCANHTFLGNKT